MKPASLNGLAPTAIAVGRTVFVATSIRCTWAPAVSST
jgi:hypothetical protein